MADEKKPTGLKLFNQTINSPSTQKYLADVLGDRKMSFVNNLVALVANNTNLQACEPYTLMFAAMKATALNMPLDNSIGMAYIIPYNDNKRGITVAQFQIGWRGFVQLALRSGMFKSINATEIREGELLGRDRLSGELKFKFVENDEERAKLPIVGYVSHFRLLNGYESVFYMSKAEVEAHAKRYSQTYSSKKDYIRNASKWTTDFDMMALKTVTKLNISKNAPLSVELKDAMQADQSVMYERNKYDYVDNDDEVDMVKAQAVADKFAGFADAEEVKDQGDNPNENQ